MSEEDFTVRLQLVENYVFKLDFGEFGTILSDEPAPLGSGEGPSPSYLLAAATANCLCASLLFALRKYKGEPGQLTAEVTGSTERRNGRLRIGKLDVTIKLDQSTELPNLEKVLNQFEDFCVVTQSIRDGIPVSVTVKNQEGVVLSSND